MTLDPKHIYLSFMAMYKASNPYKYPFLRDLSSLSGIWVPLIGPNKIRLVFNGHEKGP
jgi:hypothetical protein